MDACFKSATVGRGYFKSATASRFWHPRNRAVSTYVLPWLRLALLAMAVLGSSKAGAQVSAADKAAAEILFDRGLRLMQESKFQEACSELERSQAIEEGIGTMLYLADCYEHIGRTASAWAMFRDAASTAKANGQSDRAEVGADRAEKLESRLTSLSIRVAHPVQGLSVFRNGQLLPPSLYGVPIPVDPGDQHVTARAEGYLPFETTVTLQGEQKHFAVDLPSLQADPRTGPHTGQQVGQQLGQVGQIGQVPDTGLNMESPAPGSSIQPGSPGAHPSVEGDLMWHETLALTFGAIGLVGVGVGTYFGARAIWKNNVADEQCPAGRCPDDRALGFDKAAHSAALLSTVFWIGGAAFLLGGVGFYFTGPEGEPRSLALHPRPGGLELHLEGAL